MASFLAHRVRNMEFTHRFFLQPMWRRLAGILNRPNKSGAVKPGIPAIRNTASFTGTWDMMQIITISVHIYIKTVCGAISDSNITVSPVRWIYPKNNHTGPLSHGELSAEHAGNFMFNRQQQMGYLQQFLDRPPIVVAPYDAELFGHWWFEGPDVY